MNVMIGAHMSISGGVSKALPRGEETGCAMIQIFTKNASQWKAKPLEFEEVDRFKKAVDESGIWPVVAHDSYLVNLASPDDALWTKSKNALKDEMTRAELLGLPGLVIHPGAHMGTGEERGLERIAAAIDELHRATEEYGVKILLETTAGQGTNLGYRFEHLAAIIEMVDDDGRLGVCFDTCHTFAAGYDQRDAASCRKVFKEFDGVIGFDRLEAMHLNDSMRDFNSRLDRHEQIGQGKIGIEGFRFIMRDRRFAEIPKILETPKGEDNGWDKKNLAVLRELSVK